MLFSTSAPSAKCRRAGLGAVSSAGSGAVWREGNSLASGGCRGGGAASSTKRGGEASRDGGGRGLCGGEAKKAALREPGVGVAVSVLGLEAEDEDEAEEGRSIRVGGKSGEGSVELKGLPKKAFVLDAEPDALGEGSGESGLSPRVDVEEKEEMLSVELDEGERKSEPGRPRSPSRVAVEMEMAMVYYYRKMYRQEDYAGCNPGGERL
jgi:hypothetical protein